MYIYIFKTKIMLEIMVKPRVFYIIRIHDIRYDTHPPEVFSTAFFRHLKSHGWKLEGFASITGCWQLYRLSGPGGTRGTVNGGSIGKWRTILCCFKGSTTKSFNMDFGQKKLVGLVVVATPDFSSLLSQVFFFLNRYKKITASNRRFHCDPHPFWDMEIANSTFLSCGPSVPLHFKPFSIFHVISLFVGRRLWTIW